MKTNKQPSIFVVEDDPIYQEVVKNELISNHYTNVNSFSSGQDFLDSLHKSPDVVLLDYNLGDFDGIKLLRKIKSFNSNIQVIFLSGQERMEIAINSLKYGAYDYVVKNENALHRITHLLKKISLFNTITEERKHFKKLKKLFIACLLIAITGGLFLNEIFPKL